MVIGIVGSEAAKFTKLGEQEARKRIRRIIKGATLVVSGACHLGGIDVWAIEEARKKGIPVKEFPPTKRSWEGGYKQRNIEIAKASDTVVCITVDKLPKNFRGMRFPFCYHCQTSKHVKSGGCWTTKYARKLGKPGTTLTITNYFELRLIHQPQIEYNKGSPALTPRGITRGDRK